MATKDTSPAVEVPFNVGSTGFDDDDDDTNLDFGNEFDTNKHGDEAEDGEHEEQEEQEEATSDDDKDDTAEDDEKADDGDDAPAETEEEEGEEAEEPADEPESKQSTVIPKSRFDAINERRKQAEREAADLRRQLEERSQQSTREQPAQEQAPAFDFDAKEQEYMEAVVDGDFDKAKQIRGEIRQAEKAEFERVATEKAERTTSVSKQQADLDASIKAAEDTYPELNPTSEGFDSVLVDEVADLMGGWVRSGKYTPAQAMDKAVKTVAKLYDLGGEAKQELQTEKPSLREKTSIKEEVRKKTKAAAATPPAMDKAGEGVAKEIKVDINDLSEDEFDALPESKLRELRGDYFSG